MAPADNFTLLIADDEMSIRNGLAAAVDWSARGLRVAGTAADGSEALDLLIRLQPDVMITDIKMPGCSGLDLIERARALQLPTQFIILSGYDDFAFAQRAIRSNVASYLLKPVKTDALLEEVDRILDHLRAQRATGAQAAAREAAARSAAPMLRQRFYAQLAEGDYHSEAELEQGCAALGVKQPIACPCIAAVLRFTLPQTADRQHFAREDKRLFKTVLCNVTDELADGRYQVEYFLDSGSDMGLLLSPPDGAAAFLSTCIDTMRSISPLTLSAGLGLPARRLLEVPDSCRAAAEMVEYHMYEHAGHIFNAAEILVTGSAAPPRPPAMPQLAEAIAADDEAAIAAQLDTFFDTVLYIPTPPPRYVRGMCAYLINDIAKRVSALLQCDTPLALPAWPQEVDSLGSLAEIRAFLLEGLTRSARLLQGEKGAYLPPAIEDAQAYIRSHVLSRLRVDEVAGEVHLSASHFAALFKKSVGITAHDFILQCKLEKAKELLVAREMSIFEIADALDYSDYRSFSRAFKRFAGCSPTEYQQSITQAHKKE